MTEMRYQNLLVRGCGGMSMSTSSAQTAGGHAGGLTARISAAICAWNVVPRSTTMILRTEIKRSAIYE